MSNKDFETFEAETVWFEKPKSGIEFHAIQSIQLSPLFKATFPQLTKLIEKSRQRAYTLNGKDYTLFCWDTVDNEICGWLNKKEKGTAYPCPLSEKHQLLLQEIGGITESFNGPEESFTDNQNFIFLKSACQMGIGSWDSYYSMTCEDDQLQELDYSNLVAFAGEANGALTLYHPVTEQVLLFSHDHCYENVDFLEGQPEYTFHTFRDASTFKNYVEELARQWLECVG